MRISTTLLSLSVLTLGAAACSAEDAAESLIENAIERESGENVDIDFGDLTDGDGFSIETDEGSMAIDEDGNFVITDANGEVVTGDVNVDGDGLDISTEDGSFSIETDEDGDFTMETEDGSFSGGATTEVPDEWPGSVPEPTGFAIDSSSQFSGDGMSTVSVTGSSNDGAGWAESYGSALVAAGFEEQSKLTTAESVFAGYQSGEVNVSVQTIDDGGGSWFVTVVVSDNAAG